MSLKMNWMRRRRERISGWPSCPSSASSPWYSTSLSRTRCPSFGWVSTGNDFIIKVVFTLLCSLRPNWFIRKKLTAEGCVSAAVNVLGVFQATRGKSPGAWQPETTDRESLPRFSAALAGAGHEEGSGDMREESVTTFVTVMCSKHWRSLSVSRYSSEKF